ncbi:MAG: FecR domain-containing protein [Pirellulales bacterium]|nr:FecR domain-containing protein [Pirellulales bacterium]
MTPQQRRQLIDSLVEQEDLSEADFLRAEAELSVDAQVRREYYDRAILSMLLQEQAQLASLDRPRPDAAGGPVQRVNRWRGAFAAMAVATAASLLTIFFLLRQPDGDGNLVARDVKAGDEEVVVGFAVVSGQSEAVWENGQRLAGGSLVPSGELHLLSGLVQLELFSGVQLVIEGEARFSVLSPMEVSIVSGKARARVPEPAQGFRIHTSTGQVVDLGTDFAVDVSAAQSEVHVLDGEIEWHPHGAPARRLVGGEAVSRSSRGKSNELVATSKQFVGPDEFRQRLASLRNNRWDRWKQFHDKLNRDPRLVVHYQVGLSERWNRQLPNLAVGREVLAGEGAVVAATRTPDRWGRADGALDFSPAGSRVRLSIPGVYQSLTLLCWVKINSLDRWYNSLFLTDGHELGEPHWQIMDDGRLFFSVKKNERWDRSLGQRDKHVFYSPTFWNSSLSGQWLMIATVYDLDARQVTHYVNGRVLSEEAIPAEYLVRQVRIGNASLCNWGLPERDEPRFAVRNLNGSMDEFALFDAALTSQEIKELYDHGKP